MAGSPGQVLHVAESLSDAEAYEFVHGFATICLVCPGTPKQDLHWRMPTCRQISFLQQESWSKHILSRVKPVHAYITLPTIGVLCPSSPLPQVANPNRNFGPCFAVHVHLPSTGNSLVGIPAYLGAQFNQFGGCLVTEELADRLGLHVDQKRRIASGSVQFQSLFEGDINLHRSRQLFFEFRLGRPELGAYMHFALHEIQSYFTVHIYRSHYKAQIPFIGMAPKDEFPVHEFCEVLQLADVV